MIYLDRIFERLGVKVNHDADRIGFIGDHVPDEDELDAILARMRPDPIQYTEGGGKRLKIITTNTPAKAAYPAPASPAAEVLPIGNDPGPAKESLRAKYRRLRAEVESRKEASDEKKESSKKE